MGKVSIKLSTSNSNRHPGDTILERLINVSYIYGFWVRTQALAEPMPHVLPNELAQKL